MSRSAAIQRLARSEEIKQRLDSGSEAPTVGSVPRDDERLACRTRETIAAVLVKDEREKERQFTIKSTA